MPPTSSSGTSSSNSTGTKSLHSPTFSTRPRCRRRTGGGALRIEVDRRRRALTVATLRNGCRGRQRGPHDLVLRRRRAPAASRACGRRTRSGRSCRRSTCRRPSRAPGSSCHEFAGGRLDREVRRHAPDVGRCRAGAGSPRTRAFARERRPSRPTRKLPVAGTVDRPSRASVLDVVESAGASPTRSRWMKSKMP